MNVIRVLALSLLLAACNGTPADGADPAITKLKFSAVPIWTSGTRNSGGDGNARLLDMDQDGDLDLVTSLPNPRRWAIFSNHDGQFASKPTWQSLTTTDCDHISVLDFNGDGWMDLAGTHESHCTLYINNAGQRKPEFSVKPNWETGVVTDANQIDFADYDGDGDLDMLMASGLPFFGLALFENKKGELATRPTGRIGDREYSETAIFADVDSDGDQDVVAAYSKLGTVFVYRNDGGKFDQGQLVYRDDRVRWCQRLYCIDIDGDGRREIFCAKGPWGPPGASVALAHQEKNNAPLMKVVWQTDDQTGYHGFDFQDIDGDGDLDVAAADWGGRRVALYLQHDGRLSTDPAWFARTTGPAHEVVFGDVDGDGDLDLAVGGVDQAQVFENLSAK
ncbi:MAG: VCBS repeat-containing protein [Planctomycetota bacterium]|nr:VCBS repeat-containing protein [Planctomycetota bacterium]